MSTWETLGQADIPNGGIMTLVLHDGEEYVIDVDGQELMSSKRHGSEVALASETIRRSPHARRVLVGGLGLGFTLRSALDALPPDSEVVLAELVPEVVKWNEGPLGHLANFPLQDPRVTVRITDVAVCLREPKAWDVILLDVDNGPTAFTQRRNDQFYHAEGLAGIRASLREDGILTVWSSQPSREFERLLANSGFHNKTLAVEAYEGADSKHYLYVAKLLPLEVAKVKKPALAGAPRRRRSAPTLEADD